MRKLRFGKKGQAPGHILNRYTVTKPSSSLALPLMCVPALLFACWVLGMRRVRGFFGFFFFLVGEFVIA